MKLGHRWKLVLVEGGQLLVVLQMLDLTVNNDEDIGRTHAFGQPLGNRVLPVANREERVLEGLAQGFIVEPDDQAALGFVDFDVLVHGSFGFLDVIRQFLLGLGGGRSGAGDDTEQC
jgi:hypothetical protein